MSKFPIFVVSFDAGCFQVSILLGFLQDLIEYCWGFLWLEYALSNLLDLERWVVFMFRF